MTCNITNQWMTTLLCLGQLLVGSRPAGGVAGCYMIPIAGTTASSIHFFTWTQKFVCQLLVSGISGGWAFQRSDGSRAFASNYRNDTFSKLETLQGTTTLIDPKCNIWDDYGVQRSGRRLFTTHCINMGVPPRFIKF